MSWTRHVFIAAVWGSAAVLGACSSGKPPQDPLVVVGSRGEVAHARLEALKELRAEAPTDAVRRTATQRVYRDVAWTYGEPVGLRMAVLDAMITDPDPKSVDQAHETIKLMLPRERSLDVVAYLCRAAVDKGWTDCIPSLIRSYSRLPSQVGWVGVNEEKSRPERGAIEALSAGKPVDRVVFDAFLKPPDLAETYGLDWAQRFRADAWDLLARLDTDGSMRVQMLAEVPEEGADQLIKDIRRCVRELRAMPLTGDELKWLISLSDPKKPGNAAWWAEAAKAIASVGEDGRRGVLHLRHAEAIRWTAVKHPQRLNATRQELLSELRAKIGRRTIHQRTAESGEYRVHETMDRWESRLRWGDLISLLAIDEAVREPGVASALLTQAELDRKDTTTEYGGALMLRSALPKLSEAASKAPGEFIAMLFPPRAGQRQGDEKFIASDDMVGASDLALAHYHLHVQKTRNDEFAGPSPGDLIYAARAGRSCVVLTQVGTDRLDIDYYQPDGVVIDLGELGER
jgi:hypothetical protein